MKDRIDSREKGKRAERECAKVWSDFGFPSRRGQQYSGLGNADIVGPEGWPVEVKHCETPRLPEWTAQAMRDAKKGEIPLVCHRKNRGDWWVAIRLDDFLSLSWKQMARSQGWVEPE